MNWRRRIGLLAALAMLCGANQVRAAIDLPTLYTLHCSGCHGADGHGVPTAGIPDLHDIGLYVVLPQGRAYLVQVPGISQSRLDDATAAAMLNWVLARYSAAALPPGFTPYTAAEVSRLRTDKASDAEARRAAIMAALGKTGYQPAR
jgi:mono/diheme cytochrome c family protein